AECQECHFGEGNVIGAVKVSISLEHEYEKIVRFGIVMFIASFLGVILIGTTLWLALRKSVVVPLKELESAAQKMSEGDLTFQTDISSTDEIKRLDTSIKESLSSISGILRRVRDVAVRISDTSEFVSQETNKVVDGTMIEAEAIAEISSSIEELNAAIGEVAESTTNLTRSVQDTAASMEEMSNTIASIKDITHEVSAGVDTTSSSINELSANIKEVADNASDLGRVSDETLAAVEEITSSVKEVESSAKESSTLSQKVTEDASSLGAVAISEVRDGMDRIKTSVSTAADAIRKLGGRSEEIGNILNVIDDITDQTTLLALNASILAAQAGEHGKGFSVVANEIKDLAERTALSTHEIDSLIRSVREEVSDAVNGMGEGMKAVKDGIVLSEKASTALDKILISSRKSSEMSSSIERTTAEQAKTAKYVIEAIERVRLMVSEIVGATQEQSNGVSLIIEATEGIREASHRADSATEQQAEGSRQITRAVENISEMSQQILRAINEQKSGSKQIWTSVERIKDIPGRNRDRAFKANKSIKELSRDSDLAKMEMERFILYEGDDSDIIKLGVVPFDAPAELFTKFTPLSQQLSKETGKRFDLRIAPDYITAVKDLKEGVTQLCFMTSLTYIVARSQFKIEPVVKVLRNGRPFHRSVIFTREHSTVKALDDVKNRTMGFVDKYSASGYLVPLAMLKDAGVDLADLSFHQFIGYHDDVVKAVLAGDFDVGAVMESVFQKHGNEGVRVIEVSDDIPEFTICSGSSLPEDDLVSIREALLKFNEENPVTQSILGRIEPQYTGFVAASDEDYEVIRKYQEKVG
ncbi:MAG: phosphate/phosphite/phosphonate ABC transporter substrate-binding protein, partial [Thermodesulfovibrionales bacterium]|nr:phosphate/phosphite/phosphonate ABC transporter substrate-binding protein [Thermodesulfovibrionales bacterium]